MPNTTFSYSSVVPGFFKALARPALCLAREMPVHGDLMRQRGRGPLAVFLPAYGPEGAALLRIYAMALALRPLGWRSLVLPPRLTLGQRQRLLSWLSPSVLVMQGARHALNRPALYPGQRVVFDMDDADFHLPHLASAVRRAMPDVAAVVAGSRYVADWCLGAGAPSAHVIWTGAPVSQRRWPAQSARLPVIAWAQTRPMDYRVEADLVRRVTARIVARRPGATLRLFDFRPGDDPAFADSFRAPGLSVEWLPVRRYGAFLDALADVSVGLAPLSSEVPFSRGKSFGKVLAYLDARIPVIGSDACEHGAFFGAATGVITNSEEAWVTESCRLLDDARARDAMAGAAFEQFCARLSSSAAAAHLETVLRAVGMDSPKKKHNPN